MESKLFRIKVTQAEMHDLGTIDNIDHYVLYDSGSRIAVEITAEVKQEPLLSEVRPYNLVSDTSVLEAYLSGKKKPVNDWHDAGGLPCIAGFEAQELIGEEYTLIRQTMLGLRDAQKTLDDRLRDAQKTLDDRVDEMRKYCLSANLVKPQKKS